MSTTLDNIMERASQALALMDYLTCEALCLEALAEAKRTRDWSYYARVLLPLQESRRQRRMIACDAGVRMDAGDLTDGCIVLTRPHTADEAGQLQQQAHARRRCIEVLYIDSEREASTWTVRSYDGPPVSCELPAPPPPEGPDVTWYLQASEALGDAAIAQVDAPLGSLDRLEALEQRLHVVVDHEKLHQRLGDAARALQHAL